jgi:hypothetical protein
MNRKWLINVICGLVLFLGFKLFDALWLHEHISEMMKPPYTDGSNSLVNQERAASLGLQWGMGYFLLAGIPLFALTSHLRNKQ